MGRRARPRPWVKATHPASRHEVAVLVALSERVPGALPEVLAAEPDRGWVLLGDGGPVLRSLEGGRGVAPQWRDTLRTYATIQRASEPIVDDLVRTGVPDVRDHHLLDHLDDLLGDDLLMGRGQPWGLTPDDDRHLRSRRDQVAAWTDELATSPVRAAIQHDDLHGNNVFVDGPRVFDWGDAGVSHPFASLTATLRSIPHHTPVLRDHLPDLVATYLGAWDDVAAPARLWRDVALARHLGAVMRAMSWARALGDEPSDHPDRDAAPAWLRELLQPLPDDLTGGT